MKSYKALRRSRIHEKQCRGSDPDNLGGWIRIRNKSEKLDKDAYPQVKIQEL
jgi:hypothetical protein